MMRTLSDAIERLANRGFTENFRVVGDRLLAFESGKTFGAHELIIREFQRFEGVSDPDDMAIVYAIESTDGTRGSLVDAFGAYSSPVVSAFLHDVPIRRAAEPGAAGPA
ncbi:MAG: phosphoribosylpyrophosphate synthetase [Candidatus Rokuibacteriota bacterium]